MWKWEYLSKPNILQQAWRLRKGTERTHSCVRACLTYRKCGNTLCQGSSTCACMQSHTVMWFLFEQTQDISNIRATTKGNGANPFVCPIAPQLLKMRRYKMLRPLKLKAWRVLKGTERTHSCVKACRTDWRYQGSSTCDTWNHIMYCSSVSKPKISAISERPRKGTERTHSCALLRLNNWKCVCTRY